MSEPIHTNVPDPTGQDTSTPTTANNFGNPIDSVNTAIQDVMNTVSNFVGILVGFGFITIGIFILIQSNEKVRDAQRKIVGAAAALKPELAGAAIATNVLTGKKARAENIQQMSRTVDNKARARMNANALKPAVTVPKATIAKVPPVSKFSVPVETRTVPQQRSSREKAMPRNVNKYLPTSPNIERSE